MPWSAACARLSAHGTWAQVPAEVEVEAVAVDLVEAAAAVVEEVEVAAGAAEAAAVLPSTEEAASCRRRGTRRFP